MKETEVRERAFSMPLTSPACPPVPQSLSPKEVDDAPIKLAVDRKR